MSKLNFKEASLLDASGELRPATHRQLMARISRDSAAQQQYQESQENLALLASLPIPEPSAAERRAIPARIKQALHRTLRQHEKQAAAAEERQRSGALLFRYASAGLALAACLALGAGLFWTQRAEDARLRQQVAGIEATIDRVAAASWTTPDPYAQPPAENPDLYDYPMSNRLAVLSAESPPADTEVPDHSAPAGSY
jgi:hypothetical protein